MFLYTQKARHFAKSKKISVTFYIQKSDEIDESNNQYLLNKGTWYNTDIFSRLHGSLFEDFITCARTDIYNLICYLVAHD